MINPYYDLLISACIFIYSLYNIHIKNKAVELTVLSVAYQKKYRKTVVLRLCRIYQFVLIFYFIFTLQERL